LIPIIQNYAGSIVGTQPIVRDLPWATHGRPFCKGGTEGSNPLSSSGESGANSSSRSLTQPSSLSRGTDGSNPVPSRAESYKLHHHRNQWTRCEIGEIRQRTGARSRRRQFRNRLVFSSPSDIERATVIRLSNRS